MSTAVTELLVATSRMRPVSLDTVMGVAGLQTRVDRKYLVAPSTFATLVDAVEDRMHVLEIDRLRCFRYESVYFDTPRLAAYRRSAHGRKRTAFKVRTRTYVDSGECVLEVKCKGGRGETVKERLPYSPDLRSSLDRAGRRFVDGLVHLDAGDDVLRPVLQTRYRRSTLVDLDDGARVTCDAGLACTGSDGRVAAMRDAVLIETKSTGRATDVDRWLWHHHQRPVSISKFCVGLAALRPELPANKWNRTLRRFFDWQPDHPDGPVTAVGSALAGT